MLVLPLQGIYMKHYHRKGKNANHEKAHKEPGVQVLRSKELPSRKEDF